MSDLYEITRKQWRPVVSYEGLYEVSSTGLVRSLGRQVSGNGGGVYAKPAKVLKLDHAPAGYPRVTLCAQSGEARMRNIHELVLEAFVGPRPRGMVCRHLDGDPTNNCVENLVWGTQADNVGDAIAHGKHGSMRRNNGMTKLSEDVVAVIRTECKPGVVGRGFVAFARRYGVHRTTIARIVNGR